MLRTQVNQNEFYNSLLASKPSNTSVPTQVASKETKPAQTKPVPKKTQPQVTEPHPENPVQSESQPVQAEPQPTESEMQVSNPVQTEPVVEQSQSVNSEDYVRVPGIGLIPRSDPRVAGMGVGHDQSDDLSPEDKAREDAIIWQ